MYKVLVVDDSYLARKMLRDILEKLGHEVAADAESGEKALIKYTSTKPDLVFMDVVMPGIGGVEAAKKIRSQNPEAKVIITSAHMENNLKDELVKNNLKYLVVKPINESNVADAIDKIMSNAGTNIVTHDDEEARLRENVRSYLDGIAKNVQETVAKATAARDAASGTSAAGNAALSTAAPNTAAVGTSAPKGPETSGFEADGTKASRLKNEANQDVRVVKDGEMNGAATRNKTSVNGSAEHDAKDAAAEPDSPGMAEFEGVKIVSAGHYFNQQPIAAKLIRSASNQLILGFDQKFENYSFGAEDPLTVCYESGNQIYICMARIFETNPKEKTLRVTIESINPLADEVIDERFPASLQTDFKSEFLDRKRPAIIKLIGPYNSIISTKADLSAGEKITFNVYLEERVVTISAEVVSCKPGTNMFEYELKTTFIDLNDKKLLKLFVNQLKVEHLEAVNSLHK